MSERLTSNLGGNFVSTPKTQTTIQISSGDENQSIENLNRQVYSPSPSSNRKTERWVPDKSKAVHDEQPEKRIRTIAEELDEEGACALEVSVSIRRKWLTEFGMHHENKFPVKATTPSETAETSSAHLYKHQIRSTPIAPRGTVATSTESMASTIVDRALSSTRTKNEVHRVYGAPSSFKPKIKKDEVQATNEGYASVAKLSEWLANDPTSTKKKKHVRRGKNVISKSRNFEKEPENVIVIETIIPRGGVQDKKKMIQGAFGSPGSKYRRASNVRDLTPRYAVSEAGVSGSVSEKKDWLKKAFKHAIENDVVQHKETTRSEIIVDDAASSLSVSDKKDWLQNAFKNGKASQALPTSYTPSKKFGYNKAMTDIMHNRDTDDDAKARIKARFVARSGRTPVKPEPPTRTATPSTVEVLEFRSKDEDVSLPVQPEAITTSEVHRSETDTSETKTTEDCPREEEKEERTGPPNSIDLEPRQALSGESSSVEDDETPFDFRKARMALINRGKQNGHAIQVVNKIYTKKNKFEQMIAAESKRREVTHSLHSVAWEGADEKSGLPSNAYDKKAVPNRAPKKSLEDLP